MSRLDELLSALLDREPLSPADFAELDALLAQPAGQTRASRLLAVEAALRAAEPLGDIAGPVLARLSAARASETLADDVLARIDRDPVLRWQPHPRKDVARRWPRAGPAARRHRAGRRGLRCGRHRDGPSRLHLPQHFAAWRIE